MNDKQIIDKLKYLKNYKIPEKEKIKFIKDLYKLAGITYKNFIKNGHNNGNK